MRISTQSDIIALVRFVTINIANMATRIMITVDEEDIQIMEHHQTVTRQQGNKETLAQQGSRATKLFCGSLRTQYPSWKPIRIQGHQTSIV